MFDVLIIGGGAGGLACAITLASARSKPWFGDRRIAVIDDGRSDLHKAMLNNAPGLPADTHGSTLLQTMRRQFLEFDAGALLDATVTSISTDPCNVQTADGNAHDARTLVLATGYKQLAIDGVPAAPLLHHPEGKHGRIRLPHDGIFAIAPDVHVAGLLAGGSSQFAIAAGIGAQVAVEILSAWAGKRTHIHDTPPAAANQ